MFDLKRQPPRLNISTSTRRAKAILAFLVAIAAASPAMAQDLRCGTSTIRLVCEHRDAQDNRCDASHAEFVLVNGNTKIVRTPKGLDASLIPDEMECSPGDGGDYVIIEFSNGVGCSDCTSWDVFKFDGSALTNMGRHFDSTVEKLHIQSTPSKRIGLK